LNKKLSKERIREIEEEFDSGFIPCDKCIKMAKRIVKFFLEREDVCGDIECKIQLPAPVYILWLKAQSTELIIQEFFKEEELLMHVPISIRVAMKDHLEVMHDVSFKYEDGSTNWAFGGELPK